MSPVVVVNNVCHHYNLFLRESAKMDYTRIHAHIYVVQGDDYIYKVFVCAEACMWVTRRKNCD